MHAQRNHKRILITMVTSVCVGRGNYNKWETSIKRKLKKNIFSPRTIIALKDSLWLLDSRLSEYSIKYEIKFPSFLFWLYPSLKWAKEIYLAEIMGICEVLSYPWMKGSSNMFCVTFNAS